MNFLDYFTNGLGNTLKFKNRANFSFRGETIPVYPNTTFDTWFIGDFASAHYEIIAEYGNADIEHLQATVTAHYQQVSVTVYGRTNSGKDLVQIAATVDNSKVTVSASPFYAADGITALTGVKLTFKTTYSERVTPTQPTTQVGESSSLGGELGTALNWTGTNLPNGAMQINDSGSIVFSNLGHITVPSQPTLDAGFILETLNIVPDRTIVMSSSNNNTVALTLAIIDDLAITGTFTAAPTTTGALDNVVIGATTPLSGKFTTFSAGGNLSFNGVNLDISLSTKQVTLSSGAAGSINNMTVGATTPKAATFTNLTASGSIALTNNQNVSLTPTGAVTITSPTVGSINNIVIGATKPAAGKFTSITINTPTTVGNNLITRSQLQSRLLLGAVAL